MLKKLFLKQRNRNKSYKHKIFILFLISAFTLKILLSLYGIHIEHKLIKEYETRVNNNAFQAQSDLVSSYLPNNSQSPFYILIHGFNDGPVVMKKIAKELKAQNIGHATIHLAGNGTHFQEANAVSHYSIWLRQIQNTYDILKSKYSDIRFVGLSMGTVLITNFIENNNLNNNYTYLINPAFKTSLTKLDQKLGKASIFIFKDIFNTNWLFDLQSPFSINWDNQNLGTNSKLKTLNLNLLKSFILLLDTVNHNYIKNFPNTHIILSTNDDKLNHEYLIEAKHKNIHFLKSNTHILSNETVNIENIVDILIKK